MKKIIRLLVPIGFIAILALLFGFLLNARPLTASAASSEQAGPPWYNADWNYRRPVVITNNGAQLAWYQVLIKLDNSNFNFSEAETDGSDIRFTYSDGTTELSYWIEEWDAVSHKAYTWVRLPNIATGNNTIYLYYNNPEAEPDSDGSATFDSFEDDWGQFSGAGAQAGDAYRGINPGGQTYTPFSWTTLSGSPDAALGILTLNSGDGIKSTSSYLYNAMGMRAWFSSGSGDKWGGFINGNNGQRSMIADLPSDPANVFLIDSHGTLTDTVLLPRVGGEDWHATYHIYELRWGATQARGDIDHGASTATSTQPAQVPSTSLPVSLYSYPGSGADLRVDWIYIRQYRDPEPVYAVGPQQGLVRLAIHSEDSPDPIQSGRRLTYQLTITNSSEINATGVVVTDTLPATVQIGPISTSQGSCIPGNVVLCNLNTINANSTAWVTINVTPTVDGTITNFSSVGSPGFELDMSDNTQEQQTLVDSQPPVVNWEKPATNGGQYISHGGFVTLEASASDNDQVAWVEFLLWDHLWDGGHGRWISIGTDSTYPYQVPFDSDILVANEIYQMFVRAVDRAGNQSTPLQVIYITRNLTRFLPIVSK